MLLTFFKAGRRSVYSNGYNRIGRYITIGIRREDKNRWELRCPIVPSNVVDLTKIPKTKVIVQPCNKRIFTDKEFEENGAVIAEDISSCDIIVGVKEVPMDKIVPGKIHMCFSHTHKGQPKGATLLKAFLDKKGTLVDYELFVDEKGARILAFGKFAGYAGMINCLNGLGERLLEKGCRTPLLNIGLAHHYPSVAHAKKALKLIAQEIEQKGLPAAVQNLSFVFLGRGNVSQGAQEIFRIFPHTYVKPAEFQSAVLGKKTKGFIATELALSDYTHKTADGKLESVFGEKFASFTDVIVNGMYWDAGMPRILTKEQTKKLETEGKKKFICVADISCDIDGGIELTSKASTIDKPCFYYNPISMTPSDNPTSASDVQLMAVDNLPAELPRDASQHFSSILTPLLKKMIKSKSTPTVIEKATIIKKGALVERFKQLPTDHENNPKESRILILGAGLVAQPAVDYLSSKAGYRIILGSERVADAERLKADKLNIETVEVQVTDAETLEKVVSKADAILSLLPAGLHIEVAKACIKLGKNLVTTSYISEALQAKHQDAVDAGVTILNECGLDPGLDHLSAKKMIDSVKSAGDKIDSFVSWCGGLPAPECADNPFGYKFSWRPQGVLQAAQNSARYLLNGKLVEVAGSALLSVARPIRIHNAFSFEGLPNRDSLGYIEHYGLEGVSTMFRGTLRYRGFSELLDSFAILGFLSTQPLPSNIQEMKNWSQVLFAMVPFASNPLQSISELLRVTPSNSRVKKFWEAINWLNMTSPDEPFIAGPTMLDSFCNLLQKKMKFQQGERDMAFMFHEVLVSSSSGKRGRLTSTLIQYGESAGYTAMAKTVSIPAAMAVEMLLQGRISQKGVLAPLDKSIYNQLLGQLENENIRFKETISAL